MTTLTNLEHEFFLDAQEYCRLMTRDARNTWEPARVQFEIDRARNKLYETYKKMVKEAPSGTREE